MVIVCVLSFICNGFRVSKKDTEKTKSTIEYISKKGLKGISDKLWYGSEKENKK
jgi:hypothetical protein